MNREPPPHVERLATTAVHTAFLLYRDLGPGIMESVYERLLAADFTRIGLSVQRQQPVHLTYDELVFPHAFRPDLIVNGVLLLEVKSVDTITAIHVKQPLTYLRLLNLPLGLLLNFGADRFAGVARRVVNGFDTARSPSHRKVFAYSATSEAASGI